MSLYGRGCNNCGGSGRIHIGGGVHDACPQCFGPTPSELETKIRQLEAELKKVKSEAPCWSEWQPWTGHAYLTNAWLADNFDHATEIIQIKHGDGVTLIAEVNMNGGGCDCCGSLILDENTQWRKMKVA